MVEDNTFSVSVHYRMVAEGEDRELVLDIVNRVVDNMPMLRRTEGKMVYELRPSADWDKGKVRMRAQPPLRCLLLVTFPRRLSSTLIVHSFVTSHRLWNGCSSRFKRKWKRTCSPSTLGMT